MKPNWLGAHAAEDVVELLQDKFPDLEIDGFNDDYDIRVLREYAEAIYDMLTKYPKVVLTKVSIEQPMPGEEDKVYAWCTGTPTGDGHLSSEISFNMYMAADWDACHRSVKHECSINWGFADPNRPVYSTIIHEFGHAVDYSGYEKAYEHLHAPQIIKVLRELWENTGSNFDYTAWLRRQMSLYSFLDPFGDNPEIEPSEVHEWEALAEAFTDVELNGDNARDTSKALRKLMVDTLNSVRG